MSNRNKTIQFKYQVWLADTRTMSVKDIGICFSVLLILIPKRRSLSYKILARALHISTKALKGCESLKKYIYEDEETGELFPTGYAYYLFSPEKRQTITDLIRCLVWSKTGGFCSYCGTNLTKKGPNQFHVDHVIPFSRGGSNDIDNLEPSCRTCNLQKGAS